MQQTVVEPALWVQRYADGMLNFAFRRTNNLELSEDLVQDTLLSALASVEKFKGNSHEKTWLYSILENKIADYFRSSNYTLQKQKVSIDESFFNIFFDKDPQGGAHWHDQRKPHDWEILTTNGYAIENEELSSIIQKCLHKLPEKLARIFLLKYIEEYTTSKLCKELSITASNYWIMIHRAKLQLRECLEINWFGK